MLVGVMRIKFYLPWVYSLKEKRSEISSIKQRITQKFKVSVQESNFQDIHQSAEISVAFLTSSSTQGDSMMDNMLNYIESNFSSEIVDVNREFR